MNDSERLMDRKTRFDFSEALGVPPDQVRDVLRTVVRHYRRTGRTWILEITPYGSSVTLGDGSEVTPWIGVLIQNEPISVIMTLYFEGMPDAQGLGGVLMGGMMVAEEIPGRVVIQNQMFEPPLTPFVEHLKIRIIHEAEGLDAVRGAIQQHIAGLDEREIVEELDFDPELRVEDELMMEHAAVLLDLIAKEAPQGNDHWLLHFLPAPFILDLRNFGTITPWIGLIVSEAEMRITIASVLPCEPDPGAAGATIVSHMVREQSIPLGISLLDEKYIDYLAPLMDMCVVDLDLLEEGVAEMKRTLAS